jgi:hypothetical protein
MTRPLVVSTLLFVALALSGGGSPDARLEPRALDSSVTSRPLGLAIDAALNARPEILARGWAEHTLGKARPRLGLAVVVSLTMLLVSATVTVIGRSPGPRSTLSRHWSIALRAPPALRLS